MASSRTSAGLILQVLLAIRTSTRMRDILPALITQLRSRDSRFVAALRTPNALPPLLHRSRKAGQDAYAAIRVTIRSLDQGAIGRVVLTNREHVVSLNCGKGLMDILLRFFYVQNAAELKRSRT